jgi:hypothetical protein
MFTCSPVGPGETPIDFDRVSSLRASQSDRSSPGDGSVFTVPSWFGLDGGSVVAVMNQEPARLSPLLEVSMGHRFPK